MNRSTFRLMPYINRAKTRADGTTAILLRITIDGKKTVMTTDFSCRPELWELDFGRMNIPRLFIKLLVPTLCNCSPMQASPTCR